MRNLTESYTSRSTPILNMLQCGQLHQALHQNPIKSWIQYRPSRVFFAPLHQIPTPFLNSLSRVTAILISTGPIKKIIHSSGVHISIADGIINRQNDQKTHKFTQRPLPSTDSCYTTNIIVTSFKEIWIAISFMMSHCMGLCEAEFEILAPHLFVNSDRAYRYEYRIDKNRHTLSGTATMCRWCPIKLHAGACHRGHFDTPKYLPVSASRVWVLLG